MSLKQKVLSGTKWIAVTNIFKQILQIVSLMVFARLLSPDDFGMFAVLMIFVGFMDMFTDMGTSAALIHVEEPSDKLLSSVFYLNIFVGLLLCLVLIFLSSPISIFFENQKLEELLQIISISFIIASFGIVQKALFEKQLDFKRVTLIESFSVFVGIGAGIGSAIYGLGVYSLIVQTLLSSIVRVILMWFVSAWRPLVYFSLNEIKDIWGYTSNLFSFNLINYFARNADNFLIGKFLGSSALGAYSLAYRIMLYPLQNITRILIRILFPAFSKIKDDNEKFKKAYLRVIFFIALVSFPLMAGLIATSTIFVDVFLGDKWQDIALLIMILAPIGMIQSIVSTVGSIYMAKGNTKRLFQVGSVSTVVTVAFFIAGIPFGVEGVAMSYLVSNLVILYPVLKISWDQIDLSVKRGIAEILPVLIISIIMCIGVILVGKTVDTLFDLDILKLSVMVLSGAVIYFVLIYLKYGSIKTLLSELKK